MNAQYKPETHVNNLEEFAYYLARCMNCSNQPEKAIQAFKDVFGTIRNRLAFSASLEFINLLPLPLKAIYLDGWHIGDSLPLQLHSMEELMDEIIASSREEDNWYNSNRDALRNVLKSIFQIIGTHIGESGTEVSIGFLPQDMQYYIMHHHLETKNTQPDTSIWLS